MFNSYTSNGIHQIYFCLQNGFEHIKPEVGANAPLDEYGLSMLSIIVNEYGELSYCTSRWNHTNGGNDSVMNPKQISEVVGVNFYNTFKPNNKWNELITNVKQRLSNGENPKDIFDDVRNFSDGVAIVKLNGKGYNFINTNGKILCDQWFDKIYNFYNSFARVRLIGKGYNFINADYKLISDQWFDYVGYFYGGFAAVKLNDKCNFINTNGEIAFKQWFDWASNFNNGFARVELKGKYTFINTNGEIFCDQLFDKVRDFENGFAKVELNYTWNFINTDGKLISDQWFDWVGDFYEGFAIVELNDKFNFINTNGEILCDQWFDDFYSFSNGFIRVELNGKYNLINQDCKIICDQWFDDIKDFHNGFAKVMLNGKSCNFINTDGKFISEQWFDEVDYFYNGFARVKLNGKLYYLREDGILCDSDTKKPLQENKINNINMKQIIKLTENDLKRIISESVKRILKEDTNSFILRDVIIDGIDVTTTFKRYYGSSFDSKYQLKDALNKFLKNYGIKLIDLDLANEFGESGDEIYIYSEPLDKVEAHGGYYPHGIIPGIKLG